MSLLQRLFTSPAAGPRRRRQVALLAGLLISVLAAPGLAQAQSDGDHDEGRRIATAWCSECHQIGPGNLSTTNDAVPSFQAIVAMPSTTAMSIRVYLSTSHEIMPNFT